MQMLWNSQIKDTCVVFPQWHIHTPLHMFLSCLLIAGICIIYARLLRYIRVMDRRNGAAVGEGYLAVPSSAGAGEHQGFGAGNLGRMSLPNLGSRTPSPGPSAFNPRFNTSGGGQDRRTRVVRAGLYTLTVGVSFFLMLVAMTYNTYLFAAILVGSFVGYYLYEDLEYPTAQGKGLACH